MTTLKEFEAVLREQGMNMALAVLEKLRQRDRATRSIAPARRVAGRKMTPDLARAILEMHGSTNMTQQEIAFKLGVNQGRVNEVIKHGKWLTEDPDAPEGAARDRAAARAGQGAGIGRGTRKRPRPAGLDQRPAGAGGSARANRSRSQPTQLRLDNL